LGEPFVDFDEDGVYDLGIEPFYDFYNTGSSLGVRDGPDGKFNGALCQDPARCVSGNPLKLSAGIGASSIVILSGSTPTVTLTGGAAFVGRSIPQNQSTTFSLWIRDVNGNPMPGGTTVTGSTNGSGLQISVPNAYTVPCSALRAGQEANGITLFNFSVISSTTTGTGTFTVTVKTPKGLTTTLTVNVTVT
jgi:hypothetical protein